MRTRPRQSGLSLTEMTAVVAAVALLVSLGLPTVRSFFRSFETEAGAKSMISAALTSARAIAAKERRYAGIRFQKAYHPDGPLAAAQYMILIVHDYDRTGLANGFRAVDGLEPIKLPDTIGVMVDPNLIGVDTNIDEDPELANATTFSVIFSPSGKLLTHDVQVRNRDGVYQPDNGPTAPPNKFSADDIFNSPTNIVNYNVGMFVQDDYPGLGLDLEPSLSLRGFVVYDRERFRQALQQGQPYSGYLESFVLQNKQIHINPYTGTMIQR